MPRRNKTNMDIEEMEDFIINRNYGHFVGSVLGVISISKYIKSFFFLDQGSSWGRSNKLEDRKFLEALAESQMRRIGLSIQEATLWFYTS